MNCADAPEVSATLASAVPIDSAVGRGSKLPLAPHAILLTSKNSKNVEDFADFILRFMLATITVVPTLIEAV